MKLAIADSCVKYDFQVIKNSIIYFLEMESKLGLFNKEYLPIIINLIDDFQLNYATLKKHLYIEIFFHDYKFLDRYNESPKNNIPLNYCKNDILFFIDINSIERFSLYSNESRLNHGYIFHRINNSSSSYSINDLYNDFRKIIFDKILKSKISHYEEFLNHKCIEDFTDEEIQLVKMLLI